jgi:hypothetical protein
MRGAYLLTLIVIAGGPARSDAKRAPPKPSASLAGTTPKHMQNCPSAVASARTTASPTVRGIDLTITSSDPDAQRRIETLAQLHASQREPIWLMPEHTAMHGGPGTIGHCPIIHANTTVTAEPIAGGVRVHVVANAREDVPLLQRATEARVRALAVPTS